MRRSAGDLKRLSKSLLSKINKIYIRKHNDCKHNGQKQRIDENSAGDSAASKVNPNQRKTRDFGFFKVFYFPGKARLLSKILPVKVWIWNFQNTRMIMRLFEDPHDFGSLSTDKKSTLSLCLNPIDQIFEHLLFKIPWSSITTYRGSNERVFKNFLLFIGLKKEIHNEKNSLLTQYYQKFYFTNELWKISWWKNRPSKMKFFGVNQFFP